MADAVKKLWREASVAKRWLLVGVPVVVLALAGVGAGLALTGGSSEASPKRAVAPTATDTATGVPSPTWTPVPTETPASAGLQAGNAAPPPNVASGPAVQPRSGTGPGPAVASGMTLVIPSIGVNAPVNTRSVGSNGQMGNPVGAWDVVWYDFSGWDGLGGYPGEPGANAVFAGHVDYIHVGPAVFWSLRDLQPGDRVTVDTPNGAVTYAVEWSQWTGPDVDFSQFVAKTGYDAVTLVTCIGSFSNGHYSNRLIVRGRRV
jgi:LPXTG-site transpeptidase (sortase) family protein